MNQKCYVCDSLHHEWDMCEKHEKELYDEVMSK